MPDAMLAADARRLPTPTATDFGRLAADEVRRAYRQIHGEMPRAAVIDLLGRHSLWFHLPAVVAVSAFFGTCSFYLIEKRFLRLKSKFTDKTVPTVASSTLYELHPAANSVMPVDC